MHNDIKQLLTDEGYDVQAMEKDKVPTADYKQLLADSGYDVTAMAKDGLFNDVNKPKKALAITPTPTPEVAKAIPGAKMLAGIQDPRTAMKPDANKNTPTVLPNGKISTLTTGVSKIGTGTVANATKDAPEMVEQVVAGMRQSTTAPIALALEDSFNYLGLSKSKSAKEALTKLNKHIKDYNAKHPDEVIHPATVGNIVSSLAIPIVKGMKGMALTGAIISTLDGIGKTEGYSNVPKDAVIGAVIGGSSQILLDRLTRNLGPLSYGAQILIKKHPDLTEDIAMKILKDVPKKDQALALSNYMKDGEFTGFIKQAVASSNKDKLLLKSQVEGRTRGVEEIIGDTEAQVASAKTQYSEMADNLALDNHNTFNFSTMVPTLDGLITRYAGIPSKASSIINNMKADIVAGNGQMNVRTALQFRQDLNYLMGRASRHEETIALDKIKKGVDSFLAKNLDSDKLAIVDNAIGSYKNAMNNQDFIELLNKHTTNSMTDWVGFSKALKKEKLSSPQVDNAIEVAKELAIKFKADKQLRGAVNVTGQGDRASSLLGIYSWVISNMLDPLDTIFVQSTRHRELLVQKEILKSIRSAKDPQDIVRQISRSKLPPEVKEQATKEFNEILRIEYNPNMATSVTHGANNEVMPIHVTPAGTASTNMDSALARDNFTGANLPTGLPAPRPPLEAPTTEIPSGKTKFVGEEGRVSTNIDIANPPEFNAETISLNVPDILAQVSQNQRQLGVTTRLRLADTKTAKYGKNLNDSQLRSDRDASIEAVNLIIEKSRTQQLSRRDRESLLRGLARTRQIDRELDIREHEGSYLTNVARDVPTSLERPPSRYRIRQGTEQTIVPTPTSTRSPSGPRSTTTPNSADFTSALTEAGRRHGINITRTGSGPSNYSIGIEGVSGSVPITIAGGKISMTTTAFEQGSSIGGKFYQAIFDVTRELNIAYRPSTNLTTVNTIRLPVNIFKYKQATGWNPVGDNTTLNRLADRALGVINKRARAAMGKGLSRLSEAEIDTLGAKLGAVPNVRTGPASLRLYKRMEEILATGGTLSVALLAPYIEDAYKEMEGIAK